MKLTPLEQQINETINPTITDMGYALVQAKMTTENKRNILQILVENPKTHNIGVDECAKLSRAISALLDVEDPISGAYSLEVSSPGIDRPLTRIEDFENWKGFEAKIELDMPIEGQKKFRGVLDGLSSQNEILLKSDQGELALPFNSVHKAKLVMSDALLERTKQMQNNLKEEKDA
jgi:ribosome maturation factor RimP